MNSKLFFICHRLPYYQTNIIILSRTGTLKEVSERFEKLEDKLPAATKA
jgi:hypothetical protein